MVGAQGAPVTAATTEAETDTPAGLVKVPLPKGCFLLLSVVEYERGIRRGKWLRRREAMLKREAGR
jgi:hypothetical protein